MRAISPQTRMNTGFFSRILVGEVKKVDGEKFQEIKNIYNFVGEIPAVTE